MSSPPGLDKRLDDVEKQNREILETVGEHDKKLTALQSSVNEGLAPVKFVWNARSFIVPLLTVVMTLVSIGISLYVREQVTTQINASVKPLGEKVGSLETEIAKSKPTAEQIADLHSSLESLDQKIQSTGAGINKRIDDYLIGLAKDPRKLKRGYAHAVSVEKSKLGRSLPVAQELLVRAREEGTVLRRKDIRRFARLILPMLEKKPQDHGEVHDEVWRTVRALASYKSFVDGKIFPVQTSKANSCNGGQAKVGSGSTFENEVFVNCWVYYQGGDIILNNVRFINTEFDMVDEPQARLFLSKFLLSDKVAFSLDTSLPYKESK